MLGEERNLKLALAYARAIVGDYTPAQRAALAARFYVLTTEQVCALTDELVPTMPLLTPEVVDRLRDTAEAHHALAETEQERIEAEGLSLLVDWQDRARAAREVSRVKA